MNICYNPFSLQEKKILVTGASSGIGKACAIECSKMGAHLIITGRNTERLFGTRDALQGDGHVAIEADVTNESDIKNLLKDISQIDGAVLCAGIGEAALIPFCSPKKFKSIFETNFFSQTELIRQLLKGKKLQSGASLVTIASIAAFSYELGNSIYGAGKAALSTWIKYAAKELGQRNIRLNSICPGVIDTKMVRGGAFTDEQLSENMKQYPLGRFGRPEEIAYGAIYLLSDAASWITGVDLVIDGGYILK